MQSLQYEDGKKKMNPKRIKKNTAEGRRLILFLSLS